MRRVGYRETVFFHPDKDVFERLLRLDEGFIQRWGVAEAVLEIGELEIDVSDVLVIGFEDRGKRDILVFFILGDMLSSLLISDPSARRVTRGALQRSPSCRQLLV